MYVVDADAGCAREIASFLRSRGYEPLVFQSAIDFLRAHEPGRPGCLILESTLPILDGLQTQTILQKIGCARPIIFVARSATVRTAAEAMRAGAIDFLSKPVREADLLRAVDEGMRRDADLRTSIRQRESIFRRFALLTPREREVFERVVNGRLNKQIAAELGTVEKTVKVHRSRVMEKMGASSLPDLVLFANALSFCPWDARQPTRPMGTLWNCADNVAAAVGASATQRGFHRIHDRHLDLGCP